MVLNASLLNTQHYKVRIKGKVEQSREWSSALLLHLGAAVIEKGAFKAPSTKVPNFTYFSSVFFFTLFIFVAWSSKDVVNKKNTGLTGGGGDRSLKLTSID